MVEIDMEHWKGHIDTELHLIQRIQWYLQILKIGHKKKFYSNTDTPDLIKAA